MPYAAQLLFGTVVFSAPSAAFAHGEEVIFTLGAQLLTVVACTAASVVLLKPVGYRVLAIFGSLLGVTLSWLVTGSWPYLSNRTEITILDVGLPILGTLLVFVAIQVLRHGNKIP